MFARLYLAVACAALTACAGSNMGQYQGTSFLAPARDVSTVFITHLGDVYIVPEKGVWVTDVTRPDGTPIAWRTEGAYMVLPASSLVAVSEVDLLIDGKRRRQVLESLPQQPAPVWAPVTE